MIKKPNIVMINNLKSKPVQSHHCLPQPGDITDFKECVITAMVVFMTMNLGCTVDLEQKCVSESNENFRAWALQSRDFANWVGILIL